MEERGNRIRWGQGEREPEASGRLASFTRTTKPYESLSSGGAARIAIS